MLSIFCCCCPVRRPSGLDLAAPLVKRGYGACESNEETYDTRIEEPQRSPLQKAFRQPLFLDTKLRQKQVRTTPTQSDHSDSSDDSGEDIEDLFPEIFCTSPNPSSAENPTKREPAIEPEVREPDQLQFSPPAQPVRSPAPPAITGHESPRMPVKQSEFKSTTPVAATAYIVRGTPGSRFEAVLDQFRSSPEREAREVAAQLAEREELLATAKQLCTAAASIAQAESTIEADAVAHGSAGNSADSKRTWPQQQAREARRAAAREFVAASTRERATSDAEKRRV
jgi:hypothetical protein